MNESVRSFYINFVLSTGARGLLATLTKLYTTKDWNAQNICHKWKNKSRYTVKRNNERHLLVWSNYDRLATQFYHD